jgi:hypothetical protein
MSNEDGFDADWGPSAAGPVSSLAAATTAVATEEAASSAASAASAASSVSSVSSSPFQLTNLRRRLRVFKHVVRHSDIVLFSTHGTNMLLSKHPLFVVPKNVYVIERARLGETTTTCGDETLHDVLQDREELLRQLVATHHYSTRRTTIKKSAKKRALFNSSSLNVYFPGDYILNRQLTISSKNEKDPRWGIFKFKLSERPEKMSSKHVDSKQLSEIFHSGKLFSVTTPTLIVINSCADLDTTTLDILFMKNKGISDPKQSVITLCNTIKGILQLQQSQRQTYMKMIGQKKNTLIKLKEVGTEGSVYTFEEKDDVINYISMFLDLIDEIRDINKLLIPMTNATDIATLRAKQERFIKLKNYFKEYLQNTYVKNPVSSGEISLYEYAKGIDLETEGGYTFTPHNFAVLYYFMKRNDCKLLPEFIDVLKDLGIVRGGGKRRRRNVTRRRPKK